MYLPSISITHLGLGNSSSNKVIEFMMRIYNHWYIFKKNRKIYKGNYLFYLWALISIYIYCIKTCININNLSPLKGFLDCILKILFSLGKY